jgi:hypothetical protein
MLIYKYPDVCDDGCDVGFVCCDDGWLDGYDVGWKDVGSIVGTVVDGDGFVI